MRVCVYVYIGERALGRECVGVTVCVCRGEGIGKKEVKLSIYSEEKIHATSYYVDTTALANTLHKLVHNFIVYKVMTGYSRKA